MIQYRSRLPGDALALADDESLRCLLAQLERIDLLLQQQLHCVQQRFDSRHDMQGLVIQPQEVEDLLRQPMGMPHWATAKGVRPQWAEGAAIPGSSRLGQLVERFNLSDFERDVVLLSLLPWFDDRYAMLFAYMQDDVRKKWPTVDFALNLFCSGLSEKLARQACLLPQSPLLRSGLLKLRGGEHGQAEGNWEQAFLKMDSSVYCYLIGQDSLSDDLLHCATWRCKQSCLTDGCPAFTERLARLLTFDAGAPVVVLRGSPGSGREAAVAAAAASAGMPTLVIDLELLSQDDDEALNGVTVALRDIRLRAGCLIVRSLDNLAESRGRLLAQIAGRVAGHGGPIVCLTASHSSPVGLGSVAHVVLDMPELTPDAAEALLRRCIVPASRQEGLDLEVLARRFHLCADTVMQTLQEAELYRAQRSPAAELSDEDLYTAFRFRSQQNFGRLAQRMAPRRTFDDLVIGDELHRQLKEILAAVRHRERVLALGFDRKVSYGTGISALFHGDSGSGKTMAAEVLASALGVDLIKIDLATVVNKYVGETEKNLSRIFDLASLDAGVLFFDEADALFGKRSETRDAHDRHANIEVSYLLQRLENHPGLVVLATNNRSHLDEAFSRRLTFITRFPFPDASLRERMWREIWPRGVALEENIDFPGLARKAEVTGANIRNVALLATWLATDEGMDRVGAAHIEHALRRELSKIGRIALN
jgi:AAA+ superfamily predicted ATPase